MKYVAGEGAFGDKLVIMYLLENHGRITRQRHILLSNKTFKSAFNLFRFDHIELASSFPTRKDVEVFRHIHRGKKREKNFVGSVCRYFYEDLALSPYDCYPLVPKVGGERRENITLIQLDGRTSRRHGVGLNTIEMRQIIRVLANHRPVVLGGPDTDKYLGKRIEYRIGGLKFLIKQLLSCREFVGCDSGMSHLAGILGIPSKVIILHRSQALEEVYKFYQNTLFYKRGLKLVNQMLL